MLSGILIFSLFVSVGLASFLFLLVRGDLSPRIAVEKIKNRLTKKPPTLSPSFRDAPFRRLTDQPPRHHPILLNLQTSEGTGQACHPDVAYIPDGFGTGRWRYWMVCTPFAYANSASENPEIFASHDGVHWMIPEGTLNPLIPNPTAVLDYNSDPDMFFLNGKLWLYYRETRVSSAIPENRIYLITSADGVHWSSPVKVLQAQGHAALLMSPAVVHKVGTFRMWTVEKTAAGFEVVLRDSEDGLGWSPPVPCTVVGLPGRDPWHLDVIREEDRISALIVSVKGEIDWRLHYAYSVDEGKTWNVHPFLLDVAYEFEGGRQYRATFLKTGSQPHHYRVWYSAANRRDMFSIAHLAMIREKWGIVPVVDFGLAHIYSEAEPSTDYSRVEAPASREIPSAHEPSYRNGCGP